MASMARQYFPEGTREHNLERIMHLVRDQKHFAPLDLTDLDIYNTIKGNSKAVLGLYGREVQFPLDASAIVVWNKIIETCKQIVEKYGVIYDACTDI